MTSAREDCGMNAIIFRLILQQHSSSLLMKGTTRLQYTKLQVLCGVQSGPTPVRRVLTVAVLDIQDAPTFYLKLTKENLL